MIFAKLDVSLRDHDRLMEAIDEAGWGVLGVYTWALMHLRATETRNGVIVDSVLKLKMPRQRDTQKLVAALVKVGLWVRRDDDQGYYVFNYEKKNQTKEDIEYQRALAAERMRNVRANIKRTEPEQDANESERSTEQIRSSENVPNSLSVKSFVSSSESSSFQLLTPSQPAKARARTQHRHPETMIPASDAAAEEIAAFCTKWKLPPPENAELQQFLNVHRRKESVYRDWGACWATFKRMGETFAASNGRGRIVQAQTGKPEWMKDGDF